jgi:glycerol uptake facilitator-like aquaporin
MRLCRQVVLGGPVKRNLFTLVALALPVGVMEVVVPLVTEFVGTFMLVLTVGLTAVGAVPPGLPVSLILLSMVYAGGALSGGHYNSAVTVAKYIHDHHYQQQQ